MEFIKTEIRDLIIVKPKVFGDARGFFMEAFKKSEFIPNGIGTDYVQLNHSKSRKGVVRGLHFQWDIPMGKLMRVLQGSAMLVAVDIRKGSPTLGKCFTITSSNKEKMLLWAPAGFARGFCSLEDDTEIEYLCTAEYNPKCESGILWNDPKIAINWPVKEPSLSGKDRNAQTLSEWLKKPESDSFKY